MVSSSFPSGRHEAVCRGVKSPLHNIHVPRVWNGRGRQNYMRSLCLVKVCTFPGRLINAIYKSLKEAACSMNEYHIHLVNQL